MSAWLNDPLLIFRYPLLLFAVCFAVLLLAGWIGQTRFVRLRAQVAAVREDFSVVQSATLTLLGLIIGFTFSMALGRYDQRKNLEEEEANAIGTAYVRADFLPAGDAAKLRTLLRAYLGERVRFYTTRDASMLQEVNGRTARLHGELWSTVRAPASAQPTPLNALTVASINDVLNVQGYVQAAWWNRIPIAAWMLMMAIAVCATLLVGIGARGTRFEPRLLPVLPLIVSISFFLISDIDTPRRGTILVVPQNLKALVESLREP